MKFKYSRIPCEPTESFPNRHSILIPLIDIIIKHGQQRLPLMALLDTGADLCLFPLSVGERLQVPVAEGERIEIRGISAPCVAYLHKVTLEIGGWPHNCIVGFSSDLDTMGAPPLLGQRGFFDRYDVRFRHNKGTIEVKKAT